jgi:flagellar motor switch protein FliG
MARPPQLNQPTQPAEASSAPVPAPLKMTGVHRAAVLLMLLGDKYGAKIWPMLDPDEVKKVSFAMTQLGPIEVPVVEKLMGDFVAKLSTAGALMGSMDRAEELLSKLFPADQVAAIMSDVKGSSGKRMWQRLSFMDPEILAAFLRNEYPQTVAVILTKIRPEHAASVLAILPDDFSIDVVNRMLKIEGVQKEAIENIEETLRSEFVATITQTDKRDPHELMAEVFNSFDRQTEGRFLTALDDTNRDSAKKIRSLMFTFEDLTKLDAGSVQTLLRGVDKDTLCRALKGAADEAREFFLSNMSSRAAKNLQDDMAALGPIRLKDVDEAQTKMVSLAKDLADKGEIMISKNNAEEELVY